MLGLALAAVNSISTTHFFTTIANAIVTIVTIAIVVVTVIATKASCFIRQEVDMDYSMDC